MAKKVIEISNEKGEGRAIVAPNISKRRGKNWGAGKDNRQSSKDKPVRHPR